MNGAVVVHVAHGGKSLVRVTEIGWEFTEIDVQLVSRLEAQQSEVITTLNRIEVTMLQAPTILGNSTTKVPKIVVPPLPTELFTGRDDYLKEMELCFKFPKSSVELGKQRRFVLYGTGGIGKTQLALKFFDLHRKRYVPTRSLGIS